MDVFIRICSSDEAKHPVGNEFHFFTQPALDYRADDRRLLVACVAYFGLHTGVFGSGGRCRPTGVFC
ncbi:MAG: hypothetical protein ACPIOQ_53390, partial [Promethearchaeia archaeon]